MKQWLTILTLAVGMHAHAASLQVRPDSHVVDENGTFNLSIRLDSSAPDATPDLTPLERDFELLGQRTASQFRSINGRVEAWTDWVLTLRPRRTGQITIPSIQLGAIRSEPVTIEVKPIDPETRSRLAQLVHFETELSPESPYVQAQLIVTRRLVYAEGTQLYGELPGEPVIEGAVVRALGDAQHRSELHEGKRYGVILQRFVVFAERSGTLTIPGAAIVASVNMPRMDRGGLARRELRVASDPITVTVRPVPAGFPTDEPWLPAARVELLEDWQPPLEWAVGHPHTRTLIVRAEAAAASRIAPLVLAHPDALKIYADPPEIAEQIGAAGVIGIRTETMRLIPTQPGAIELPAPTIAWWNTTTDALEYARLPARTEHAVGDAIATTAPSPTATARSRSEANASDRTTSTATTAADWNLVNLAWTFGGIALIAGALVLARLVRRRVRVAASSTRGTESRAFKTLRRACANSDPRAARAALDAWLAARDGSVTAGMKRFQASTAGAAAVVNLNACLYGAAGDSRFDGAALVDAARAHRRSPQAAPAPLPGLYGDAVA